MRIVVDLQGAQTTGSRTRGIGRYSLAMAREMARQAGDHEIWIALNGLFPDTIEPLRAAFDGLIPQQRIRLWQAVGPVAEATPANRWRRETGERLREACLAGIRPDVVHVSSLFEGLGDDALTSVGEFDRSLATAVTLYDLIPLIRRDLYLRDAPVQAWYERKLRSMRQAGLWLAISESSRREGIEWLDLPEDAVVNVSTAADPMFRPVVTSMDEEQSLRLRYGLARPFLMYTGGIDRRKNIEGLIRAYAALPPAVRASHQLAIVCSAGVADIAALGRQAAQCGLDGSEVICTGFVPDGDMVALYNLCAAFVFPSWHEGFGLPVLEAMSCGAAAIGANTSSVPEVIGRADALFDPHDEHAMAAMLHAVLTDCAFRDQLRRHALEQAGKFSWERTARRALAAFEWLHERKRERSARTAATCSSRRLRLACVSPLPPAQSGIADYSAALIPELARHYEIDVVVDQDDVADPWIRANCPIRTAEWFDRNADRYDRILYHFGNSAFHMHMFELLGRHPGTVVLHDFFLSSVLAHMEWLARAPGALRAALYASHGYHALGECAAARDSNDVVWRYPANLDVLSAANGVIVHSEFARKLAADWYGEVCGADWTRIPLLRRTRPGNDRGSARAALGLTDEDFLVCTFGMTGPIKLSDRLLESWMASPLAQDLRCHLAFVGENDSGEYGASLLRRIASAAGGDRVRVTGYVTAEVYGQHIAAADVAVQLRSMSRGETSAAVLDCMAGGVPTIVNAQGAAAELPSDCVKMLPEAFSDAEMVQCLSTMRRDPALRRQLGERGREWVRTQHHPYAIGDLYRDAIERYAETGPHGRVRHLATDIAGLDAPPPSAEAEWMEVAECIAQNQPDDVPAMRQWLVDVSELVQSDARSGIQRVVRELLLAWLHEPPHGFRVEPVYCDDEGSYRYARRFTLDALAITELELGDAPMEARPGDVFLGLDLFMRRLPEQLAIYRRLRNRGIRIYFVLYDMLPVRWPERFPSGLGDHFGRWLQIIAEVADAAISISRTVADEMLAWLDSARPTRVRPFSMGWFHLGADVVASDVTEDVGAGAESVPGRLHEARNVLMVGTVEPRKGYAQALDAFEMLWQRGVDVNLVIVGKEGWMVESLAGRLRGHRECGRHLFWFERATDETLSLLYEAATGVLMASEGEGFGLPMIEADRHRRPVLARDLPVFREIAGDHASYFAGLSAETLASALEAWLDAIADGRTPEAGAMARASWAESARRLASIVVDGRWHARWPRGADSGTACAR